MSSIWSSTGEQTFRAGRGAVTIARGPVSRSAGPIGPRRAVLELVPLLGGRPDMWDVCGHYHLGLTLHAFSQVVHGHEQAAEHFRRLEDAFAVPGDRLRSLLGADDSTP